MKSIFQNTSPPRDTLYQNRNGDPGSFRFDEEVASVFDDMLPRSVPGYRHVIEMTALLLARFLRPGELVYDLGCSTGTTVLGLATLLDQLEPRFIGVDSAPAMVAKARRKTAAAGISEERASFQEGDITTIPLDSAGGIVVHYTMQFIAPENRPAFLARLHDALRPGGVLVVSEKVTSRDPFVAGIFTDLHVDFKRRQGYSDLEIARKRDALETVLVPLSIGENLQLLREAGFSHAATFCQWFSFASFFAVR